MADKLISDEAVAAMSQSINDVVAAIQAAAASLQAAAATFQAHLRTINLPPSVNITGPVFATVGDDLHYIAVVTDPENDAITGFYWWKNGVLTGETGNTLHLVPDAAGTIDLAVTVTEAGDRYSQAGIRVTVNPKAVNQPPQISIAGPGQMQAGQAMTYTATASDPDGVIDHITWALGGTQVGTGTTYVYQPSAAGSFALSATAFDNAGASTTATINISVTQATQVRGLLPTFDPGPKDTYATFPIPGAVQVAPTQDLGALVDAAAPGTVFELLPGTHRPTTARPKAGMKFIGHGLTTILDYGNQVRQAFVADWGKQPAKVVLANFVIQGSLQGVGTTANGIQAADCAVQALDSEQYESPYAPGRAHPENGWTLDRLKITKCTAGAFLGTGGKATNCQFVSNYQIGVKLWGDGQVLDGCDMSFNNVDIQPGQTQHFDTGYEAGGMKSWKGNGHRIINCRANGNTGSGIWLDYTGRTAEIDHCETKGNTSCGVALETSIGPWLHRSIITGNGGDAKNGRDWFNGGVQIYASPGVIIEDNTIDGGVIFQIQDRGLTGWAAHPNGPDADKVGEVQSGCMGALVRNNTIITNGPLAWSGERIMVQTDFPPYTVTTADKLRSLAANMVWSGNTYLGVPVFCTAFTTSTNPWDFNVRHYTDLAGWRALGRG